MTGVDTSLAIGLMVALALSVGNGRAWAWLLAASVSYAVSTLYWRAGLPYAPFIAGMMDALICLGVYFFGKLRWEMWMWRLFQFSVGINIIQLGGQFGVWQSPSHNAYAIILEAINWLALLFIGGSGAIQMIGAQNAVAAAHRPWDGVLRFVRPLYRERSHPPFHRARKGSR